MSDLDCVIAAVHLCSCASVQLCILAARMRREVSRKMCDYIRIQG